MRLIDEIYLKWPFYGARRIAAELRAGGWSVDRKRVGRLMRLMGIQAAYPAPRTSTAQPRHRKYPYLLRGLSITHADHVWSSDITTIPMKRGFLYLVAVMDWYSRFVLSWQLSSSLDTAFCIEALEDAFRTGKPKIFNSDQGCQYTSVDFTAELQSREIAISMDGRGRFWDNIWIERLWRTVKYEEIYLNEYADGVELFHALTRYFSFYNHQRRHQALDYQTPANLYSGALTQEGRGSVL